LTLHHRDRNRHSLKALLAFLCSDYDFRDLIFTIRRSSTRRLRAGHRERSSHYRNHRHECEKGELKFAA
jgi:hypothetical protein